MSDQKKPIVQMNRTGKIIVLCVAGFGVLMAGFGCWFLIEAQLTRTWDKIDGTIINTEVRRRLVNRQSAVRSFEYYIELRYQYKYQEQVHQGERYSLGDGSTLKSGFDSRQEARNWLAESDYTQGSSVVVSVKPGQADQTVLSAGVNSGTVVPLILGLFFMSFAILFRFNHPPDPSSTG